MATTPQHEPITLRQKDRAMPADQPAAYDSAREALTELRRVTGLRQPLIDAAARAFLFHYLRQPQAARLFTALDDLDGMPYIGPAGYRRAVEILTNLQHASHALQLLDGDAGAWMRPPLIRMNEHLEKTLPRMKATAAAATLGPMGRHFSDRYEGDFAVDAVRQAVHRLTRTQGGRTGVFAAPDEGLPGPGAAGSASECRTTALRVDGFIRTARSIPAGAFTDAGARGRLQYLIDLGTEVSDRFTATACVLEDARELGGARNLLASLEAAQVTEAGDIVTVVVPSRGAAAVRRGPDGRWTFASGPRTYASPEGAVAALLRSATH